MNSYIIIGLRQKYRQGFYLLSHFFRRNVVRNTAPTHEAKRTEQRLATMATMANYVGLTLSILLHRFSLRLHTYTFF